MMQMVEAHIYASKMYAEKLKGQEHAEPLQEWFSTLSVVQIVKTKIQVLVQNNEHWYCWKWKSRGRPLNKKKMRRQTVVPRDMMVKDIMVPSAPNIIMVMKLRKNCFFLTWNLINEKKWSSLSYHLENISSNITE